MRFGQGPLGPDDALGDGRGRDQERPRDLLRRQAAEDAESEGDSRVLGKDRMASHEDETEQVVPNVILDRRVQVDVLLSPLGVTSNLLVLALERLPPAD